MLLPIVKSNPFQKPTFPEKMIWTASSLRLFRKCKRKFFWKYIFRLRTRTPDKNLAIGHAFHHAIGDWYLGRRSDMALIAKKYYQKLQEIPVAFMSQEDADKFTTMVNTFQGMMMGYAQYYQTDRPIWQTNAKAIEKKFEVDFKQFELWGKIDLLANEPKRGGVVVDHKTSSNIRPSQFTRLPLDTQMRCYVTGAYKSYAIEIREICYDVIKKCRLRRKSNETPEEFNRRITNAYLLQPQEYFCRAYVPISKEALESFEYELYQTHDEYEALRKSGDWHQFLPNDGACDEYFRECEYLPLCLEGVKKSSSANYDQSENLHDELVEEED